ncbi:MAG: O-antigen ligase family protein [Elusimicrobia bacterium]|nr:O-antigen ligase family protein [Elusimicrobiota bacterium]
MIPGTALLLSRACLLSAVFLGPLAFGCVEPLPLALLEILAFLGLFFCALSGPRGRRGFLDRSFLPAFLLFGALGWLQLIQARSPVDPRTSFLFTAYAHGTRESLVLWAAGAAILWSVPRAFESRRSLRGLAWALFLSGALVSGLGLWQQSHGNSAIYGWRPVSEDYKPFGPYYNRDHAGWMLVISALMGCGLLAARIAAPGRTPFPGARAREAADKALIVGLLSLIGAAIIATGSRGAPISLLAALGLASYLSMEFIERESLRRASRLALGVAACGFLGLAYFSKAWIGVRAGTWDFSVLTRFSLYRGGLELFMDYPFFGTGLGAFRATFPLYQSPGVAGLAAHVHSDWLELLIEAGAIGFGLYIAGLSSFLRFMLRRWIFCASMEMRCLLGAALAAVAACLIHGLLDFSLAIPANVALFLILLGFMGAAETCMSPEAGGRVRPPASGGALLWKFFLCGIGLGGGALAALPGLAALHALEAQAAPLVARPALLERALCWDPRPDYRLRLSAAYMDLSRQDKARRRQYLRQALAQARMALEAEPLSLVFRRQEARLAKILARAGESPEAQPSGAAELTRRLGPIPHEGRVLEVSPFPWPEGIQARCWRYRGRDYVLVENKSEDSYLRAPQAALGGAWRPLFSRFRDVKQELTLYRKGYYLRPGQALALESRFSLKKIIPML